MKIKNLFYVLLLLTIVSCKKEYVELPEVTSPNEKATSFRELNTQENFDWATQKNVSISVQGLKTQVPINRTIKVSSADGKTIYYTGLYLMETSNVLAIKVPSPVTEVKVTYGSIEKIVKIASNKANFSFMPEVVEIPAQ